MKKSEKIALLEEQVQKQIERINGYSKRFNQQYLELTGQIEHYQNALLGSEKMFVKLDGELTRAEDFIKELQRTIEALEADKVRLEGEVRTLQEENQELKP